MMNDLTVKTRPAARRRRTRRRGYVRFGISLALLAFLLLLARACNTAKTRTAPHSGTAWEDVSITVFLHRENRTTVMALEDYVAHCVSGEMPASYSTEALKAQAVAARTYAVRRMTAFSGDPCGRGAAEVCTDSACCQSYKTDEQLAERWGTSYSVNMARMKQAADETRGIVLTYDGEPIEALYHSTSGGRTEDSQNVFSAALPYLVSVESGGEEDYPRYSGGITMSKEEFCETVNRAYPKAGMKKSTISAEVISRYDSGRVKELRLGGVVLTGREARELFDLDSAWLWIEVSGDAVNIITRGYGHGVGMSQTGADSMAKEGFGFADILAHYYTGAELTYTDALAQ